MEWVLRWIVAFLFAAWAMVPARADVLQLDRAEAAMARADGAPTAWKPVTLPDDWEASFPGHSGSVWYRLRFAAPDRSGLGGVYIQRACTNLEVFLNGELIGSGGTMEAPVARNCYYPQLIRLPGALLKPEGNELRIRVVGFAAHEVSARQRAAGLSAIQLGPMEELQPAYDRQLFWNVTVAQIIATTVGVLGLAMLGLFAARRRDTYLLYFGLFTTGWALISTRLFIQHVPLPNLQTEVLICSAFPPVLACAYLFLMRFIDRKHRWMDAVLWTQALAVPVVLELAAPAHLITAASTVYNLVAVEFLLCVAYFFRTAWKERRHEFWLLGAVLLAAVVLVGMEIALQNNLLPLPRIHVIHFAMPFMFIVIGARLIQLFVQALNRAETANQELEHRVAEKSLEIERNYEQLTELRTAQAAQNERQRIASDLHDDLGAKLLTIAQASGSERVAGMARQALDEMRLSVRGLTAEAAPAADVLADWRAECVTRLAAAGFDTVWDVQEPPPGLALPARTHVQLTRILREAVSNAIRHSGGTRCRVHVAFDGQLVTLEVEDDGQGLAAREPRADGGHGLPNIERRVRSLHGTHRFGTSVLGGVLLSLQVPLEPGAAASAG